MDVWQFLVKARWVCLFIMLSTTASAIQAATTPPGKPVRLSAREKDQLEAMACKTPYNIKAYKINAFRFQDEATSDKRVMALVECEAHGTYNNKPIRYIDDCDWEDHQWLCSPPQLEVVLLLNGRDIKMRPWGMSPEAAQNLLTTIGKAGYFQGESLDKALGSSCDVSKTKDPEIMELKCDAVIGVSFWCPQLQITGCPRVLFVSHD